jgi:hypothetical protein
MTLLIYLISIILWVIFSRQRRRHVFELGVECRLKNIEAPKITSRLPLLEGLLTTLLGVYLFGIGFSSAIDIAVWGGMDFAAVDVMAATLAGGATMVYVGARALMERWKEREGEKETMENGKWRMEN